MELEIGYDLAGGPDGWLVERVVARIEGGNMRATLLAARRILSYGMRPVLSKPAP